MSEIFTIPNVSLLYQLLGALILGWALAFTRNDVIHARAGAYWDMNPPLLRALVEQRFDAFFGIIILAMGYIIQLIENIFSLQEKNLPKIVASLVIILIVILLIYFFSRSCICGQQVKMITETDIQRSEKEEEVRRKIQKNKSIADK